MGERYEPPFTMTGEITTLNTYTHLGFDDAKEEMNRISESRATNMESMWIWRMKKEYIDDFLNRLLG